MIDVLDVYKQLCAERGVPFQEDLSVLPYDDTTLFCPAGMQQFKPQFKDPNVTGKTIANVQRCIRLNDIDEIGDGTHLGVFHMIGLFSFRDWPLVKTFVFFQEFMVRLGLGDRLEIHLHPDVLDAYYDEESAEDKWEQWIDCTSHVVGHPKLSLANDEECTWTDGEIGGYCTEFYVDGVEVGNIVNPLGTCIDVGFGLERLDAIVNGTRHDDTYVAMLNTIRAIYESDVAPSNLKQGYVLRRLVRTLIQNRRLDRADAPPFEAQFPEYADLTVLFGIELARFQKAQQNYAKHLKGNEDKDAAWWWDTHGVRLEEVKP